MSKWISSQELRERLNFAEVLQHYGVELKVKGKQHQGFCPLPTHDGKKRSPSFSANLEKSIWQCFGCGQKGNAIDFAILMEGLDPKNGADFRKVALKLRERFLPGSLTPSSTGKGNTRDTPVTATEPPGETEKDTAEVVVNAALDFELQGLDPKHPYLAGRGFMEEAVAHFGLGFCARGLMSGRIAIPIHDQDGKLVGYAGRIVDDQAIDEENPKYKLPPKRDRNGVVHEFQKSRILYGGHRLPPQVDELIVVEGFPSVWWLWQAGYRNVVALMGSACSDAQAKLIVERVSAAGRVWVFPDGDDAGTRCAESLLVRLAPHRFTRWVKLEGGRQPTDCAADGLRTLIGAPGGGS